MDIYPILLQISMKINNFILALYNKIFHLSQFHYMCKQNNFFCYFIKLIFLLLHKTVFAIVIFPTDDSNSSTGLCLVYVICVSLHIVVSNTYCYVVVFFFVLCTLFCLSFSGLSIFDCPFSVL
jgi:hypothetical protein